MKTELNKLFHNARTVSMTVAEHQTVKRAILKYVEDSPKLLLKPHRILSPFSYGEFILDMTFGIRHSAKKMAALASMAAVFAMTVTTLFAAEGTLPGDTLYTVKLNVNEKVVSSFVNNPKGKIKREAELAERRLAEAELVAQSKSVRKDVDNKDMILLAENFEEHAQNFHDQIKEVKEQNRDEALKAGVSFESVLNVYDETITSAVEKDSQAQGHLKDIQAKIAEQDTQTEDFISLIAEEKNLIAAQESLAKHQKQVKKKVSDLKNDIEALDNKVAREARKATTTTDIFVYTEYAKRVNEAHNLIDEAKLRFKNIGQATEAPKAIIIADEPVSTSTPAASHVALISSSTAAVTDATTTGAFGADTASTTIDIATTTPIVIDVDNVADQPKNESISQAIGKSEAEEVKISRDQVTEDALKLQGIVSLLAEAESIIEAIKSVVK